MTGILEITLNGKQERIHFNQYAKAELCKIFMKPGEVMLTQSQLLEVVTEKYQENSALLLKQLVYAGIVGDSYSTRDTPRLTKEEVGQYIGNATDEDLYLVWSCFLEAQGFNLNFPTEEGGVEEKKS